MERHPKSSKFKAIAAAATLAAGLFFTTGCMDISGPSDPGQNGSQPLPKFVATADTLADSSRPTEVVGRVGTITTIATFQTVIVKR